MGSTTRTTNPLRTPHTSHLTGAASTRLQDIANNSGNSTLINSTEGVLYAEIAALSSPVDSPKNITISDGTVNNYVRIEYYQDGRVYGNVYDGTSVAAQLCS